MRSNLLQSRILRIQDEYKNLLKVLMPKLTSGRAPEALDEISLFWVRHADEVQLYLKAWFCGEENYVFTAITYMDYDDGEHYPFLLMGNKHIVDDPLGRYARVCELLPNDNDAKDLYKQIGNTAADNIKILDNLEGDVLILPLRSFNVYDSDDLLQKVAENIFVNLFNGIDNISDYFSKCKTFHDIVENARNDIETIIKFSEDDNLSLEFEERFRKAVDESGHYVDKNKTDAENFFMLTFGGIQQAVSVIIPCMEMGFTPFMRYPVALHYSLLLLDNLNEYENARFMKFRICVAFLIHELIDKDAVALVPIKIFLQRKKEYDFESKLKQAFSKNNIDIKDFSLSELTPIIISELEKLYDYINSADV